VFLYLNAGVVFGKKSVYSVRDSWRRRKKGIYYFQPYAAEY
jgi:hypothetical protein